MTKPQQQPNAPLQDTDGILTADELRSVSDAIAGEFPLAVEEEGLILMDVDPFHLHVYWNQSPRSIEAARKTLSARAGAAHLVIRFRELPRQESAATKGLLPLDVFDLELESAHGDADVRLGGSGRRYQAELGFTAADGGWLSLARSNPVQLPPVAAAAEPGFDTWEVGESQPPVQRLRTTAPAPEPRSERQYLLDPSLRGGGPDELETSFPNTHPQERAPEAVDPDASHRVEPDLPHAIPDNTEEEVALALPGLGPQPPGHQGGSSSSGMILELQAELHLSGRARPGHKATLFDLELPVAPDGRFSLTLPLDSSNPMLPLLVGVPRRKPDHS